MTKTLALIAFTALGLTSAIAEASYDGPVHTKIYAANKSCSTVQRAIRRAGVALVYESRDIFDKYVSHEGYCARGERIEAAWISTADTDACPVFHCRFDDTGD